MSINQRISKLEQLSGFDLFDRRLRQLLTSLDWDVEASLPFLKPHQRELAPLLRDGGGATQQAHARIHQLVPPHLQKPPQPAPAPADDADIEPTGRERVIQAMLQHSSIAKVAQVTGMAEETLDAWMRDPSFQQDLIEARRFAFLHAEGSLQQAAPEAAQVLARLVTDPQVSAVRRIRVSLAVFRQAKAALAVAEQECHLAKLETAVAERLALPNPETVADRRNSSQPATTASIEDIRGLQPNQPEDPNTKDNDA